MTALSDAKGETPELVELNHSFFKPFEDPHFRMSEPTHGRPLFVGRLGENEVAVPVRGILRECKIAEDSPDGRVLVAVERALKYVTALRFGDPFPLEMRTGEASWKPTKEHRDFANQRITIQLVSWLSGKETLITDPLELQQLFDDPGTKQKINDAFAEAARELGLDGGTKDDVAKLVESLAEELAFIEALRDRYNAIVVLRDKLEIFRKTFHRQMSLVMEIDPVRRLIGIPVKDLGRIFEVLDAQTGEILSVLKNIDAQRGYIRGQRDDLHCRLMAWDDILKEWETIDPHAPETFGLTGHLRSLYRFLAPRFMPVDEWVLMTAAPAPQEGKAQSAMTW